ncbi:MAG: M12 family metallo-peptidase [Bacteroidota bacterium]|nr:M12 family metallo-peptidase [Bacteroidota bacterium]
MKNFTKFILIAFFVFCLLNIITVNINKDGLAIKQNLVFAQDNNSVWLDISPVYDKNSDSKRVMPLIYRNLKLNLNSIRNILDAAPFERSEQARNSPFVIELPTPEGKLSKFYVTEYAMMEPDLASQFPDMKTYNIKGIDDPYATGKIDITNFGFHGMVLTPNGDYFIDPVNMDNREIYMCYYKSDYLNEQPFECLVDEQINNPDLINNYNSDMTGQQLRTYRLAVAADGEYTIFHGGTVALAQSAIVTAINRVNGVYEREVSVRMVLIANNTSIIYINPATDPYTDNDPDALVAENQANVDAVIGNANYDLGHVFTTGGGGLAFFGVCNSTLKARACTGRSAPIGDPYYIDFVAHEIGHQFHGNHTFNGTTGSCATNRNATTAWEPGSGSTIMPYAGICPPQDLQPNSDAYFHSGSVSELTAFTQTGQGNTCPVITNTGNTPPTVTVPAGGFTIPISTPFALTGSATDVETPGALTYCWEEFDLGPAGAPTAPVGNAPIFRSFSPVVSPTRTFPKLSNLLNNTSTIGEILPTYTRGLTFRLTARDNSAGGGGINFNTLAFNVSSTSGPFLVTSPNTNVTWAAGAQTVTWNVANTTLAPVSCALVNIKLSSDGGNTFPTTLLANTANDGTQSVTIPNISTSLARIKVESVGNVFFDISNTNFTIGGGSLPPLCEDFSGVTFAPTNWSIEFTGTNFWSRNTVSSFGAGTGSAKFDYFNANIGTTQSLVTLTFQPSVAGDSLKLSNAYAPFTDGSTDTLEILTSINGGTNYSSLIRLWGNNVNGNLNTAAPIATSFTPAAGQWSNKKYLLPVGTNKVKFRARSGFGNNLYLDSICKVNTSPPTILLCESFAGVTFAPVNWNIEFTGTNFWTRNAVSGYGVGSGSAWFNYFDAPMATTQSLVTLTFSNSVAGDSLKFDNAYAPFNDGSTDTLEILSSINGGTNYSTLIRLWGNNVNGNLNTAAPIGTAFTPTAGQWATKRYSLPVGTNKIKFRARSGFGNNLYLDNICKVSGGASSPLPATITLIQEGYYNTITNKLSTRDTARFYLRNISAPYAIVDSGKAVIDSNTLAASVTFANALTGTYYLVAKSRNTIETWSKAGGEPYTRGAAFSYNYTTAANKAFGNNMIQVDASPSVRFAVYSGDVNQDRTIDLADVSLIDNDSYNFVSGYVKTDLTGDKVIDIADLAIADNNAFNFVSAVIPAAPITPVITIDNVRDYNNYNKKQNEINKNNIELKKEDE